MKKFFAKFISVLLVITMLMGGMGLFASAEETEYKVGDIIELGLYPQSTVKNSRLLGEFSKLEFDWVSYNYYYSGNQKDYMQYCDFDYNGEKYRAVKISEFRPQYSSQTPIAGMTFQELNGMSKATYVFKYEPIKWRVLDPSIGLLMSEYMLDAQPFNDILTYKSGLAYNSQDKYGSNYETSTIREWLNGTFYNTSFNEWQQSKIKTVTVKTPAVYNESQYASADTNDRVFLPSVGDLTNTAYGFKTDTKADVNRVTTGTQYAKSQGMCVSDYSGNTSHTQYELGDSYWLRSAFFSDAAYRVRYSHTGQIFAVTRSGEPYYNNNVTRLYGIRPMIVVGSDIDDVIHEHHFEETTHTKNCTDDGYILHSCTECDYSYKTDIEPATGHQYTDTVVPPTETESGYTRHICDACGHTYDDNITGPLGHTHHYTSETTKDVTCDENGIITYTCTCGDVYTEEIQASGHKFVHTIQKATCTDNGLEYDYCSVCEKNFNERVILTGGHNFSGGVCEVCGKVENWDYIVKDGKVTITGYTGKDTAVDIPSRIIDYPVVAIAESAFENDKNISFISVPDSVTSIGANAFRSCSQLKEIYFGEGVAKVDCTVFANSPKLAIVSIISSKTSIENKPMGNDSRLSFIVPVNSTAEKNASTLGIRYNTFEYPTKKDDKNAIHFSGTITLYQNLEYRYWQKLVTKYADTYFLAFDKLTFDGVNADQIVIDEKHVEHDSRYLTMNNVYISVKVEGKSITFHELMELLKNGKGNVAISFVDEQGVERNFFEKVGDFFTSVFNAISKAVNSIIKIFKRK